MPHLRRAAVRLMMLALPALAVPMAATHALDARGGPGGSSALVEPSGEGWRSGPFVGADGATYSPAPYLVPGRNGRVFFGEEFDAACGYGRDLDDGLGQLARLARVIERTGRHVVFTVAPNKSAVSTGDLPDELPHGRCDARGIAKQNRVLDRFSDPRYVQVRDRLERRAARGAQMYWQIDTHWTTVAASEYAMALSRRLNPRIADLQAYRATRETISIDLAALGLVDQTVESGPARVPTSAVRSRPAGNSPAFDPATLIEPKLAWRTAPASRTWRGSTLLLGDSFTYRALPVLLPLFRHGRFLWLNAVPDEDVLGAIPRADTVVIEIVQRYVGVSVLVSTEFRRAVARALRAHDTLDAPG